MSISKLFRKTLAKIQNSSKPSTKEAVLKKDVQVKRDAIRNNIITGDHNIINIICYISLSDAPDSQEQLLSALVLADLHELKNLFIVAPDGSVSSLAVERQAELLRQYRQELGLKDRVLGKNTKNSRIELPQAHLFICPQDSPHSIEITFDDNEPLCPICQEKCLPFIS